MVTMKDVAKAAGVSMITVSRVINSPELVKETTREKVEKAMKELDFLPNHAAKALAENNTRAIHLYVPKDNQISEPFIMQLIAGVSEELSKAYYLFLIRRELEFNQRCDGVIVMGLHLNEEEIIKDKLNVPFVLFGKTELDIDCIDIDNFKGAYEMTEHLIGCGHSRIGFLALRTDQRYSQERMEGYIQALKDHFIPYDDKLVRYVGNMERDSYSTSEKLISEEKPSAIFCCNDFIAVSAFRASENQGLKVPEDISIAGFDGLTFDLIAPRPLTTVRQPVYEAGRKLAVRLLQRLKEPDLPYQKTLMQTEMVIRNTVARK